jgi:Plectin/S10 domain
MVATGSDASHACTNADATLHCVVIRVDIVTSPLKKLLELRWRLSTRVGGSCTRDSQACMRTDATVLPPPRVLAPQFVTKKNRLLVYQYLFQEGVLVAKKDFFAPTHGDIPDVPNLEVLSLMKSMRSRELVRETFNW